MQRAIDVVNDNLGGSHEIFNRIRTDQRNKSL